MSFLVLNYFSFLQRGHKTQQSKGIEGEISQIISLVGSSHFKFLGFVITICVAKDLPSKGVSSMLDLGISSGSLMTFGGFKYFT